MLELPASEALSLVPGDASGADAVGRPFIRGEAAIAGLVMESISRTIVLPGPDAVDMLISGALSLRMAMFGRACRCRCPGLDRRGRAASASIRLPDGAGFFEGPIDQRADWLAALHQGARLSVSLVRVLV